MAVAVLERDVNTLEKIEEERKVNSGVNPQMTADEQHNAQIREAYARLISDTTNVDEVLCRSQKTEPVKVRNELFAEPYFAESARTNSEIFRADSPVNRRLAEAQTVMAAEDSEEENEDLRPTSTTIQYKTYGVKKTVEEGEVANAATEKRTGLSKKEKIIIAAVVAIIVAMLVLIIVNSAVISNINADLGDLQSSLTTVKLSYSNISDEVTDLSQNAIENAKEFAESIGMIG